MGRTARKMKTISLSETASVLKDAERILLCAHVQPDGDAIGSLLALGELLQSFGKQVTLVCHNPVPGYLNILPGWEQVRLPHEVAEQAFDLACSVDSSDLERLGDAGALFMVAPCSLVIDHHASNTLFGQLNYVDNKVAASGNLIYRLYEAFQQEPSANAATCLYTALSTDTGNFSYGQMDEEFFLQLGGLMRAGLDITSYARALHLTKDLGFIRLLTRALNSLTFECEGRLSIMKLYTTDFEQTGTSHELTEGLVNKALNITGVRMCFLATQLDQDNTKFSLRALAPYDVAQIATEFGGGGHLLAAGCTVNLPMEVAVSRMKERMLQAVCT